jgi:hypothetical protein
MAKAQDTGPAVHPRGTLVSGWRTKWHGVAVAWAVPGRGVAGVTAADTAGLMTASRASSSMLAHADVSIFRAGSRTADEHLFKEFVKHSGERTRSVTLQPPRK